MLQSGILNIAKLKAFVQQRQMMLYPLLLFACLQLVNKNQNRFHLCYEFEEKQKKLFYVPYQDDFEAFYQRYVHNFLHEVLSAKVPENVLRVYLSAESIQENDATPQIEIVKFSEDEIRLCAHQLPEKFVDNLQTICDDFEVFLSNSHNL